MQAIFGHILAAKPPTWWRSEPLPMVRRVSALRGVGRAAKRGVGRHRHGFTLLELMLAMIIVATLVPVLYSAMHAAFSAKKKAEAAVEPSRTAELSMDILRQDLADALPPRGTLANAFIGTSAKDDRGREADDVIFFSTTDGPQHATANGEIKQVELTILTTSSGDHVLVRKVTRDAVGLLAGQSPIPDVEVVCRGVGGFTVRYFDGYHWGENWDSTQTNFNNELPAAVQVILTLDREGGNTANGDGSRSYQYTRTIPLACSYAAFDTTLSSGFTETQ